MATNSSEILPAVKQHTKYSTQVLRSSFKWKLENLLNWPDSFYVSEKVDIPQTNFYWCLQMNPSNVLNPTYVPLKFFLSYHGKKIDVEDYKHSFFSFSIKIKEDSIWKVKSTPLAPTILLDSPSIAKSKFETELSPEGCLELDVTVKIKSTRLMRDVVYRRLNTLSSLSDDMETALEGDELKDVTFVIGKRKVMAHKAILAARSPVFKKMFQTPMKEAKHNVVKISDIKFDTLEEMIYFIYTGRVTSSFPVLALELFEASDKYEIESLKAACELEISENLNEENAAAVLELAKFYDCDENLKEEAFNICQRAICNKVANMKSGEDFNKNFEFIQRSLTQLNREGKGNVKGSKAATAVKVETPE